MLPPEEGQALIDKFVTMLSKGVVKYVPWDACVSKEQEMLEEPAVKGLRITTDGLLLQDVATDITTKLSGEFLWDFALRRRACAVRPLHPHGPIVPTYHHDVRIL